MVGWDQIQNMKAGTRGTAKDFAHMTNLSVGHIRRVLNYMTTTKEVRLIGSAPNVWIV